MESEAVEQVVAPGMDDVAEERIRGIEIRVERDERIGGIRWLFLPPVSCSYVN